MFVITPSGGSIMQMIELHFPYPILKHNYPEEERVRYSTIAHKLENPLWITVCLFLVAFFVLPVLLIPDISEAIASVVAPAWHYRKWVSGFMVIYSTIFSVGFCFTTGPLLLLRLRYGYEYAAVLDFLSFNVKMDLAKISRRFSRIVMLIALGLFLYDISNCTIIGKQSLYTKQFDGLPHSVRYTDVHKLLKYISISGSGVDTVYCVTTNNNDTIELRFCEAGDMKLLVENAPQVLPKRW